MQIQNAKFPTFVNLNLYILTTVYVASYLVGMLGIVRDVTVWISGVDMAKLDGL